MNRNKRGIMPEITRATYKAVKKYDRQQFMEFCTRLYGYGYEDGRASVPGIDVEEIITAVANTKGIGTKKLEDIKASIGAVFERKGNDNEENIQSNR